MLLMKDREVLKLRKSFEKAIVEITIEKIKNAQCENEINELKKELRRAKTSLDFTETRLTDKRLANVDLPKSLLTVKRQEIVERDYLNDLKR